MALFALLKEIKVAARGLPSVPVDTTPQKSPFSSVCNLESKPGTTSRDEEKDKLRVVIVFIEKT